MLVFSISLNTVNSGQLRILGLYLFTKRPDAERRMGCVVDDVMTPNPVTLRDTDTLHEAVEMMGRHHIDRIVVTDDTGRITGILTGADLIRLFYN